MKSIFFMCLALLFLSQNAAMSEAPSKRVFPYKYNVKTLDNGLKVIMIPMSSKGLVSMYSIVRTGSRDEWEPGHTGFAHFFEHMMFRGTINYPAEVYDKMITEMGADANAYTTDDYTAYHLTFSKDDLERVILLESDRFQNLHYEEPAFQTEAGAVHGEYMKNKTNPWQLLVEKLQETAFTAHTYRHTTMGFEADIKAMPTMFEYSKSFFSRYYRPENVVLIFAGDINPDETLKLIGDYYGKWRKGYVEPKIPAEPPQKGERKASVSYPGKTLPILTIAYKGDRFDPANKSMVAAILLGNLAFGENSDLYKKLFIKEQKVQMLSPDIGLNRDPTLWAIYAMIKDAADVSYVRDEIYKTVEKYKTVIVEQKKLTDLKNRLKYGFLMDLDTPDKVAGNLARYVAITGGIEAVDQVFEMYDQITPQDIMDAAKKYLSPEARTIITLTGSK